MSKKLIQTFLTFYDNSNNQNHISHIFFLNNLTTLYKEQSLP